MFGALGNLHAIPMMAMGAKWLIIELIIYKIPQILFDNDFWKFYDFISNDVRKSEFLWVIKTGAYDIKTKDNAIIVVYFSVKLLKIPKILHCHDSQIYVLTINHNMSFICYQYPKKRKFRIIHQNQVSNIYNYYENSYIKKLQFCYISVWCTYIPF